MKNRSAFTMIELIFVIVIMGIIGKFGVEFLAQAYNSFIYSSINNRLQSQSAAAVESIAAKLQFRIKDSIIAKDAGGTFHALAGSTLGDTATVLEWVGSDVEGFRGNLQPMWSGIIDLDDSISTLLDSPQTDTNALNTQIRILAHGNVAAGINRAALYFIGSDSNVNGYGWNGNAITTQNLVMHPIIQSATAGVIDKFIPVRGDNGLANNFIGVDVYEYYQLAWTAYAVELQANGNLILWYDYQPWRGDDYTDGKDDILMENVSTFQFKAVGSVVKIQVCVESEIIDGSDDGDYSLCKEKTIF